MDSQRERERERDLEAGADGDGGGAALQRVVDGLEPGVEGGQPGRFFGRFDELGARVQLLHQHLLAEEAPPQRVAARRQQRAQQQLKPPDPRPVPIQTRKCVRFVQRLSSHSSSQLYKKSVKLSKST